MRWIVRIVVLALVVLVIAFVIAATFSFAANRPGRFERAVTTRLKLWRIGGKDQSNPLPDTAETQKMGAEHFQHHCGECHGLDGQNTGVPFADKMSPPVANLASPRVQKYTDGQLKWIIDNGIRFTGMPAWKGILEDDEAWAVISYIRHLPPKGSLGMPAYYREAEEEHEHAEQPGQQNGGDHAHPQTAPEKPAPPHSHPH